MTAFASYAFNKSHAAAYGVVAVQTAWLKYYYPAEFMAAMMNSVVGNTVKINGYIQECRDKKIPVLKPDMNRSQSRFSVEKNDEGKVCVRFGLIGIRNVGGRCIDECLHERDLNGSFSDLFDFCRRCAGPELNKRALESLIKAGCFDYTGVNRAPMLAIHDSLLDAESRQRKVRSTGQLSLFDSAFGISASATQNQYPDTTPFSYEDMLRQEREMTGVYLSGHPLEKYAPALKRLPDNTATILELSESGNGDGKKVRLGGLLVQVETKITKKGDQMAYLTLEDLTGQIECLAFPRIYQSFQPLLQEDQPVIISGRLSVREDEAPRIVVDSAEPLLKQAELIQKLYLRVRADRRGKVEKLLAGHPGRIPVYLNVPEENKTYRAPESLWVADDLQLMSDLTALLGSDNVRLV